ncbi:AraC family transcriptional regulator [Thalassotalea sp. LPB0316]|uniref:AraC family transcriptional regulator n=1 Tax=Thalassotalea sp. LPB0316 TaxID=2769490 RepID=UPI001865D098|nr:AraC family transcriptional regulator [Thalassotalea sp. LPB0316]QOL25605.1 AraC family transcriptional regulator [Thalassotalea sp. LPB0316]
MRTLSEQVTKCLLAVELPAALTLEHCAKILNMSSTTFRRKLASEGTSYKAIQTKFLNALCVESLILNNVKIDELATRLGYSERATFERAFKQKFGITPSQYRSLATTSQSQEQLASFSQVIETLPPMPQSCVELIKYRSNDNIDLDKVVAIVAGDPVFSGRVIGQASKAIYGKTPLDLREAISRNLGIDTVINIAVLFGVSDALHDVVDKRLLSTYHRSFSLTIGCLKWFKREGLFNGEVEMAINQQVLMFGLIGIFLLNHRDIPKASYVIPAVQGIDELSILNRQLKQVCGVGIFGASALMLSQWHIDTKVVKWLLALDKLKFKAGNLMGNKQACLFHFMLDCIYRCATGHQFNDDLYMQAKVFGVKNLDELKAIFDQ